MRGDKSMDYIYKNIEEARDLVEESPPKEAE